jgi:glycosyltransferase involved in cell wall biosynthesis
VTLTGHVPDDDLAAIYTGARALVFPSDDEGFGLPPVEAMACGTPVIGSSSGQIPWVVESTGGGLIFPEGDVERLGQSIELLARDPGRRERLAKAGKEATSRLYTAEATAELLERFLENARRGAAGDREPSARPESLSSVRPGSSPDE